MKDIELVIGLIVLLPIVIVAAIFENLFKRNTKLPSWYKEVQDREARSW